MTTTTSDVDFSLFVDRLTQALCFMQGMQMAMATMHRPAYQATAVSGAATRRSLGALGLTNVPGTRAVKLTAAQLAELEAKRQARALGFVDGRFVGGAA